MTAARRTFIALLTAALGLQWAVAAEPAEPARRPPTDVRQSMLRTWREGVSVPDDKQDPALAQAVRELQAMVQPGPQSQSPAGQPPLSAGAPGVAATPATKAAAPAAGSVSAGPATQPTTQPGQRQGMSPAELDQLKSMEFEKFIDPAGAADAIYQAGQYEAALAMYQRLSDHQPAGAGAGKGVSGDWLMFQLANCNGRLGRHEEALKLYQQLIATYPQSPWVAVAKVQGTLAGWRQAEKPADLLKQVAPGGAGRE